MYTPADVHTLIYPFIMTLYALTFRHWWTCTHACICYHHDFLQLFECPGGVLLGTVRTAVVTIVKSDYPNGKFSFLGETERSIPNPDTPQSLVFYVERTEGLLGQQEVLTPSYKANDTEIMKQR